MVLRSCRFHQQGMNLKILMTYEDDIKKADKQAR